MNVERQRLKVRKAGRERTKTGVGKSELQRTEFRIRGSPLRGCSERTTKTEEEVPISGSVTEAVGRADAEPIAIPRPAAQDMKGCTIG